MRVLIIDNYDSFTFNLYQYVGEILSKSIKNLAFEVIVKRNDELSIQQIRELKVDRIIISPGPGSPDDTAYFGICADIITQLGPQIPLMGVCLGMQGISHCFGAAIVRSAVPMHGKVSPIRHDGLGFYANMPQQLEIMRYHSLMVDPDTLPACLEITSIVDDQFADDDFAASAKRGSEIMGVRHREYPIEGIQYHPESFATEGGKQLLKNFLL